jgi:hypothetical protein
LAQLPPAEPASWFRGRWRLAVIVMVLLVISSPCATCFYCGRQFLFTDILTSRRRIRRNFGNMRHPRATGLGDRWTDRQAFTVGRAKFLIARKIGSIVVRVMSG